MKVLRDVGDGTNTASSWCSIEYILSQIDVSIQYGEDADVKIKDFDPEDDWRNFWNPQYIICWIWTTIAGFAFVLLLN